MATKLSAKAVTLGLLLVLVYIANAGIPTTADDWNKAGNATSGRQLKNPDAIPSTPSIPKRIPTKRPSTKRPCKKLLTFSPTKLVSLHMCFAMLVLFSPQTTHTSACSQRHHRRSQLQMQAMI